MTLSRLKEQSKFPLDEIDELSKRCIESSLFKSEDCALEYFPHDLVVIRFWEAKHDSFIETGHVSLQTRKFYISFFPTGNSNIKLLVLKKNSDLISLREDLYPNEEKRGMQRDPDKIRLLFGLDIQKIEKACKELKDNYQNISYFVYNKNCSTICNEILTRGMVRYKYVSSPYSYTDSFLIAELKKSSIFKVKNVLGGILYSQPETHVFFLSYQFLFKPFLAFLDLPKYNNINLNFRAYIKIPSYFMSTIAQILDKNILSLLAPSSYQKNLIESVANWAKESYPVSPNYVLEITTAFQYRMRRDYPQNYNKISNMLDTIFPMAYSLLPDQKNSIPENKQDINSVDNTPPLSLNEYSSTLLPSNSMLAPMQSNPSQNNINRPQSSGNTSIQRQQTPHETHGLFRTQPTFSQSNESKISPPVYKKGRSASQ